MNIIKFSIIIPVYNNEEYLEQSISSVYQQIYKNFELIVIDDCSNDSSPNILAKLKKTYNFKLINNLTNLGKFKSLNNALKIITGNYFLVLDSDDYLSPERLIYDYAIFKSNPNILSVQSKYVRINPISKEILLGPVFGENITTYSAKLLDIIGYYNENRFGGDSEYLMRFYLCMNKKKFMIKYDKLTYYSNKRNTNNLTSIYNIQQRKKFINEFHYLFDLYNKKIISNIKLFSQFNFYELINKINWKKINPNPLEIIDLKFYKKCYLDLQDLNMTELKKHWETIGLVEKRLNNILKFYIEFPNFNYKLYIRTNNLLFQNKYTIMGWIYLKHKKNYAKWLKSKLKYANIFRNITFNFYSMYNLTKINEFIADNKINYICNFLSSNLNLDVKLNNYLPNSDRYENTMFVGFDNSKEIANIKKNYQIICQHNSNIYLLWTNPNINLKNKWIQNLSYYLNMIHLSSSKKIQNILLENYNISSIVLKFN